MYDFQSFLKFFSTGQVGGELGRYVTELPIFCLIDCTFKETMSHLQAPKNKEVKFQRHLKDNTNLELP